MVAYIGTGHLGANFVRAMLRKGQQVQVWNRTAAKARALEAHGATAFANISEAVKGADRVHLTLVDDLVVDEVLAQACAGFSPGITIIDHTTTSAAGAIRRTQEWKDRGFTYLHAPVFMGPVNAFESTGHMLVSGDPEVIKKLLPVLSAMTGEVLDLGPVTGKAAGMKLVGNLFLLMLTSGITDAFSLAKGLDISPEEVLSLFNSWNPGAHVPGRMKRIIEADFDHPYWELKMARKDARLMTEGAAEGGAPLAIIPVIAKEMDRWIEAGYGEKDWTVVATDAVAR